MKQTLQDIAELVKGTIEKLPAGTDAGDIAVTGVGGLQNAGKGALSFFKDRKYAAALNSTGAAAVLVPKGVDAAGAPCPLVRVKNVDEAFNRAIAVFVESPLPAVREIDPRAAVSGEAEIAEDVYIGPFAVVEPLVSVGSGTVIFPNVYVGKRAVIGEDCVLWPGVTVCDGVIIGNRVTIHPGSVIGSDGFGYAPSDDGIKKLPQIGTVLIEDDVEIGACVTIDRARFDKTVISRGTKLDNLIQIAHNVKIGEHSMLAAQVGIAGSTTLGAGVLLGGQVGVTGHIEVGPGVRAAAKSGITKSHPGGVTLLGNPAWNQRRENEVRILARRLPEMRDEIKHLKERVERLEADAADN
jgi:UDP-3-O-[3-hydroxymyristoyl] glucosamine N-acyltransferase